MRGLFRAVVFMTAAVALVLTLAAGATARVSADVPHRMPHAGMGDSTSAGMQHGQPGGHLPGSSANVELIGELEPTDEFGAIVPGQIADLAVYKDFAYLNSWNEETCTKGGV